MDSVSLHNWIWTFLILSSRVISTAEAKLNFLQNNPPVITDFTKLPATSTITLYDCSESHRPMIGIPNAYEIYHNKEWYPQSCQDEMVWNQNLCRCQLPSGKAPLVQCRNFRATSLEQTGRYEQFVNGQWRVRDCSLDVAGLVWSQAACRCVWGPHSSEMVTGQDLAPCDIMLNITFEKGVKDSAKNSFIEIARGGPLPIFNVNMRESTDENKAAYFADTAFNVWHFADNELGTSLRIEFRFKAASDSVQSDQYHIFLSNGCNKSAPGIRTPSLAIGYRAGDQSYLLAFETVNTRKAIVCTPKLNPYDWHTVALIYEDGKLLFTVDDQPCIFSKDFSGPVQKTPCPLTVGADPLVNESVYKGYMDNILIARHCRNFIDTEQSKQAKRDRSPMPVESAEIDSQNDVETEPNQQSVFKKEGSKHSQVPSTKYMSEYFTVENTESVSPGKPNIVTDSNSDEEDESTTNKERYEKPRTYRNNHDLSDNSRSTKKRKTTGMNFEDDWNSQENTNNIDNGLRHFERKDKKSNYSQKTKKMENVFKNVGKRTGDFKGKVLLDTISRNYLEDPKTLEAQTDQRENNKKNIDITNSERNELNEKFNKKTRKFEKESTNRETKRHNDDSFSNAFIEFETDFGNVAKTFEEKKRVESSGKTKESGLNFEKADRRADENKFSEKIHSDARNNAEEPDRYSRKLVGNKKYIPEGIINQSSKKIDSYKYTSDDYVGQTDDKGSSEKSGPQKSKGKFFVEPDKIEMHELDRRSQQQNSNKQKTKVNNVSERKTRRNKSENDRETINGNTQNNDITNFERKGKDLELTQNDNDFNLESKKKNIQQFISTTALDAENQDVNNNIDSSSDLKKVTVEETSLSKKFPQESFENNIFTNVRALSIEDQNAIYRKGTLRGRLHWYDNGEITRHYHPNDIHKSQSSKFIFFRKNEKPQKSYGPNPTLVKGRRRSGIPNDIWYNKGGTTKSPTKEPLSSENQNIQTTQGKNSYFNRKDFTSRKQGNIKTGTDDSMEADSDHLAPKSSSIPVFFNGDQLYMTSTDYSMQNKNINQHRQNEHQDVSTSKALAAHEGLTKTIIPKSATENYNVNDYSRDYEGDSNVPVAGELLDNNKKREQASPGHGLSHTDSDMLESNSEENNEKSQHFKEILDKNQHLSQESKNNKQDRQTYNNTPNLTTSKDTDNWYNQDPILKYSPYNGIEYERVHAGDIQKQLKNTRNKGKNFTSRSQDDYIVVRGE